MGTSSLLVVGLLAVCGFVKAEVLSSLASPVNFGKWELNDFLLKTPADANRRVYKEPPHFLSQLPTTPVKDATGNAGSHGVHLYNMLSNLQEPNATKTNSTKYSKPGSLSNKPSPRNTILKENQASQLPNKIPTQNMPISANFYTPYAYAKLADTKNTAFKGVYQKFPSMTHVTDSSDHTHSESIVVASAVNAPKSVHSVVHDSKNINSSDKVSKKLVNNNVAGSTSSNNIKQSVINTTTTHSQPGKRIIKPTLDQHENSITKQSSLSLTANHNNETNNRVPVVSDLKATKNFQQKTSVNAKVSNDEKLKTASGVRQTSQSSPINENKTTTSQTSAVKLGTNPTRQLETTKANQVNKISKNNKTNNSNVVVNNNQLPKSQTVLKTEPNLPTQVVNVTPNSKITKNMPSKQSKSQTITSPKENVAKNIVSKSQVLKSSQIKDSVNKNVPVKQVTYPLKESKELNKKIITPTATTMMKGKGTVRISDRSSELMAAKKVQQQLSSNNQIRPLSPKPNVAQKILPQKPQVKVNPKTKTTKIVEKLEGSSSNTVPVATKLNVTKSNKLPPIKKTTSVLSDKFEIQKEKQKKFQEKLSNWQQLVQTQDKERRDEFVDLVKEYQQLQQLQYPTKSLKMYPPTAYNPSAYPNNMLTPTNFRAKI